MAVKHAQTVTEAINDALDSFDMTFDPPEGRQELIELLRDNFTNLIRNKIMPVSLVIDDCDPIVEKKFDKFMECLI